MGVKRKMFPNIKGKERQCNKLVAEMGLVRVSVSHDVHGINKHTTAMRKVQKLWKDKI
jgi:hypothetical protein